MYTDKITQAVAEAVKQILATEKLHPNQQKLDVHEPEKDELTSNDFKMLRKGKKADVKEGWQDMLDDVKKRAGPQPSGGSGVKQGSRYGGSKQKDEPEDKKPMKEEATGDEFKNELKKAQDKSMGKDKAEVSKASTQAVRQEAVEQIEEKHLTEPEMKKKEEVAKSMKKGLAGFKERYGDKAKSVMYATATKIAKDKA